MSENIQILSDTDKPLLQVADAKIHFSLLRGTETITVQAVRGVSFSLAKGSILGIVGESGSGKSVTTSLITALLPANAVFSGSVIFNGTDITALAAESGVLSPMEQPRSTGIQKDENLPNGTARKNNKRASFEKLRQIRGKKIGMIFQEPGRSFDPLQNIGSVFFETFRSSDPSISRALSDDKAAALLEETGLSGARNRLSNFPHQFSGGQLQRIGIALSLAQGCELLIADEPTTALDVTIQAQIAQLLRTLRRTRGISIIFISHNIDLVASLADKVIVMYGGLIMESGPTKTITQNPSHPYTKALLAAAPSFGSHYSESRLKAIPGRVADPARPESGCPFAPRCPLAVSECSADVPQLAAATLNSAGYAPQADSSDSCGFAPCAPQTVPDHTVRCIRVQNQGETV